MQLLQESVRRRTRSVSFLHGAKNIIKMLRPNGFEYYRVGQTRADILRSIKKKCLRLWQLHVLLTWHKVFTPSLKCSRILPRPYTTHTCGKTFVGVYHCHHMRIIAFYVANRTTDPKKFALLHPLRYPHSAVSGSKLTLIQTLQDFMKFSMYFIYARPHGLCLHNQISTIYVFL